ncbi:hypothetical protein [Mesorhizobium sp. A556]
MHALPLIQDDLIKRDENDEWVSDLGNRYEFDVEFVEALMIVF